jgi:hypothetical protein
MHCQHTITCSNTMMVIQVTSSHICYDTQPYYALVVASAVTVKHTRTDWPLLVAAYMLVKYANAAQPSCRTKLQCCEPVCSCLSQSRACLLLEYVKVVLYNTTATSPNIRVSRHTACCAVHVPR